MKEKYEFRIDEREAHRLFSPDEGEKIGYTIRKITIDKEDARFKEIGSIRNSLWEKENPTGGSPFFYSWNVTRKYTRTEFDASHAFLFTPVAYFEPCGEDCGTLYDDAVTCPKCGAGAKQIGPLFLNLSRIPKKPDIAVTIAGEIVVNERLSDLFKQNNVTGLSLGAIRQKGGKDLRSLGWRQFMPQPSFVEIIPPTRTGITPFDEDVANEYRCPNGDTIGLNFLSEITIDASSRGDADVVASRQFIGRRAGLLRPQRSIFISQKVRRLFEEHNIKGYRLEVAHIL